MEIYEIENESGLEFSVQKTNHFIDNGKRKQILPDQVTFLVEGITPKEDLTKDGDLVISITKDEAKKLVETILSML
ncbi:MAG: hypothetical protein RR304_02665 [Bacteroides sp.]